jgi:hypothetical protein
MAKAQPSGVEGDKLSAAYSPSLVWVGVTPTGIPPLMGEIPDATLRRQGEALSAARQVPETIRKVDC